MGSLMTRYSCLTFLLLLLCCPPLVCSAEKQLEKTNLSDVLNRLQDAAADTRSLSSDFVQEKHLAIFAETLLSEGHFFYRQPDHLRWELLTPVHSGFVLRGQQGERWNGLSKETSPFGIDKDPIMGIIAKQLLAWAKVDIEWLKSRYRIELLSNQPVRLQLFPLDEGEASFVEQLQILFAADSSHVERVEMYEVGGDKTLLRFGNVQLNQPLPVEAFQAPEL
jgi:outer membrane lipoprotein-sorting protein